MLISNCHHFLCSGVAARLRGLRATASAAHASIDLARLLPGDRCLNHWGRHVQVMSGKIWLELLQEDENKCNFVFLWQVFQWCLLDFLHVQVQVLVRLQNIGRCI